MIDKPGTAPPEIDVSLDYGYCVALMCVAGDRGHGPLALVRRARGEREKPRAPSIAVPARRMECDLAATCGSGTKPDRNLALELVRVTEAAALAAARWVGRGEKESADGAAVDAMRLMLDTVPMDGIVVIGEGEKDEAPMLYNGERIGDGSPPEVDIAVDPLEGTRLTRPGQAVGARR